MQNETSVFLEIDSSSFLTAVAVFPWRGSVDDVLDLAHDGQMGSASRQVWAGTHRKPFWFFFKLRNGRTPQLKISDGIASSPALSCIGPRPLRFSLPPRRFRSPKVCFDAAVVICNSQKQKRRGTRSGTGWPRRRGWPGFSIAAPLACWLALHLPWPQVDNNQSRITCLLASGPPGHMVTPYKSETRKKVSAPYVIIVRSSVVCLLWYTRKVHRIKCTPENAEAESARDQEKKMSFCRGISPAQLCAKLCSSPGGLAFEWEQAVLWHTDTHSHSITPPGPCRDNKVWMWL